MGRRDDDDTLEGPKPGKCLIGCTGLLVNLIHVSPIGLVQFADFVSDGERLQCCDASYPSPPRESCRGCRAPGDVHPGTGRASLTRAACAYRARAQPLS